MSYVWPTNATALSQTELEARAVVTLLEARGWEIVYCVASPSGVTLQVKRGADLEIAAAKKLSELEPTDKLV